MQGNKFYANKVADEERVEAVEEVLQQLTGDDRQGKEHYILDDAVLTEIDLANHNCSLLLKE